MHDHFPTSSINIYRPYYSHAVQHLLSNHFSRTCNLIGNILVFLSSTKKRKTEKKFLKSACFPIEGGVFFFLKTTDQASRLINCTRLVLTQTTIGRNDTGGKSTREWPFRELVFPRVGGELVRLIVIRIRAEPCTMKSVGKQRAFVPGRLNLSTSFDRLESIWIFTKISASLKNSYIPRVHVNGKVVREDCDECSFNKVEIRSWDDCFSRRFIYFSVPSLICPLFAFLFLSFLLVFV